MPHPFFARPVLSRRTFQHPAGHITGAKGAGCEPLLAAHQVLLSYSAGARSHASSIGTSARVAGRSRTVGVGEGDRLTVSG